MSNQTVEATPLQMPESEGETRARTGSAEPVTELQLAAFEALLRGYPNSAHSILDSAIAYANGGVARCAEFENSSGSYLMLFKCLVNKSLAYLMPFESVEAVQPDVWLEVSKLLEVPTRQFINRLPAHRPEIEKVTTECPASTTRRENVELARIVRTALFLSTFAQLRHAKDPDEHYKIRETCTSLKHILQKMVLNSPGGCSEGSNTCIRLFGRLDDEDTWQRWILSTTTQVASPQTTSSMTKLLNSSAVTSSASSNGVTSHSASTRTTKDWNKIMKELDKEIKDDEETEARAAESSGSQDSLMALLRSVYQRSGSDTRRAMLKSYETSQGTVLSTNWSEVAEADYTNSCK